MSENREGDNGDASEFGKALVNSLLKYKRDGMLEAMYGTLYGTDPIRQRIVVTAWFKDGNAVERWYFGTHHREFLKHFMGNDEYVALSSPLKHVPADYAGGLMVVASVSSKTAKDIAIEVYQPAAAGLGIPSSRLAPPTFVIPHFNSVMQLGWSCWIRKLSPQMAILYASGAIRQDSPNIVCKPQFQMNGKELVLVVNPLPLQGPHPDGPTWVEVSSSQNGYSGGHGHLVVKLHATDKDPLIVVPIQRM